MKDVLKKILSIIGYTFIVLFIGYIIGFTISTRSRNVEEARTDRQLYLLQEQLEIFNGYTLRIEKESSEINTILGECGEVIIDIITEVRKSNDARTDIAGDVELAIYFGERLIKDYYRLANILGIRTE